MSDFCRACGADIPPRDGEGTCPDCAPKFVRIEVPAEDPETVRIRDNAHWNDIDLAEEVWDDEGGG